ncbi:hypothetical protein [Halorubrum cibi]|uniref:Uncharacterized protein n=1 Tax=Halorubrum cibi TaxID=413815 RepID=A0A521B6B1_9EURY|nr:hypothetical protein [Halorubrum cibi]SMO42605.1 hypothetical protein SAMN06264867_10245 [Halorubrum cibi]
MTELRHFLTSLFDAVSEAEMQALLNGRTRLERMVESGRFPEDVSLPVYHANDLSVSLDVGLEAKRTKRGIQLFVTEPGEGDDTALEFDLEVYDFLEAGDLPDEGLERRKPDHRTVDVHVPLEDPPAGAGREADPDDYGTSGERVDPKEEYYRKQEREEQKRKEREERERREERKERERREEREKQSSERSGANDERTNDDTETDRRRSDRSADDEKRAEPPSRKRRSSDRGESGSSRPFLGIDLPEGWPLRRAGTLDATDEGDEPTGEKR